MLLMLACILSAVLAAPVIWSAFSTHACFYDGQCACGHDIFVRIVGDGYFSYSPGHRRPEHLKFKIRRTLDQWEVLGLPHSEDWLARLMVSVDDVQQ